MAFVILVLLQRIFLMSSLMLLLVWLIFFMVLIKLLPILGTISGKTVKLMIFTLFPYTTLFRSLRRDRCGPTARGASVARPSGPAATDRKSTRLNSSHMSISYVVFCLKKKMVWLIFFMVLIKLLPILGTISGKTVKLMLLTLICLGNNRSEERFSRNAETDLVCRLLLEKKNNRYTMTFLSVWHKSIGSRSSSD